MKHLSFCLLFFSCTLFSETFYVHSATGDDNAAGTREQPWKSISHAVKNVKAGDTVLVGQGNYPEAVTVSVSGTEDSPITFQSVPPRQAKVQSFELKGDYITIDGFDITNEAPHSSSFGISAGQLHLKTSQKGCRMLNNVIHDIAGTAIYSGENALVKGNLMKNVYRGVFANSGTLVEDNEVDTLVPVMVKKNGKEGPKKTQYTFFSGDDITFRGNYLHGAPEEYLREGMGVCFFASWDAWVFPSSHRILIENNRCFNATHGSEPTADARKESSHITYRNNLFVNTVFVGILCKQWSHITVENNTFINCGAYPIWFQKKREAEHSIVRNNLIAYIDRDRVVKEYNWKKGEDGIAAPTYRDPTATLHICDHNMIWGAKNRKYGPNDFTAEPEFVDPAKGDYRLKSGSPGIDAGALIEKIQTDLLGTPRPQGRGFDVGAFETVR